MQPRSIELGGLAAAAIMLQVRAHAEAISLETGDGRDDVALVIRGALAPPRLNTPRDPDTDKRVVEWRCRFRIYSDLDGMREPLADTDPDLEAGEAGTVYLRGLKAVADFAAQTATDYHASGPLVGLDSDTLDRKILGLRPTLSRRDGNAVWRLKYNTPKSVRPGHPDAFAYMVRVDLERIGEAHAGPARLNAATHPPETPDGQKASSIERFRAAALSRQEVNQGDES